MRKNCPECPHANHEGKLFCNVPIEVPPPRVDVCHCAFGAPRLRVEARFTVNEENLQKAIANLKDLAK